MPVGAQEEEAENLEIVDITDISMCLSEGQASETGEVVLVVLPIGKGVGPAPQPLKVFALSHLFANG